MIDKSVEKKTKVKKARKQDKKMEKVRLFIRPKPLGDRRSIDIQANRFRGLPKVT